MQAVKGRVPETILPVEVDNVETTPEEDVYFAALVVIGAVVVVGTVNGMEAE